MEFLKNLFLGGNDPNVWLLAKILMSFVGSVSAYLWKYDFFKRTSDTRIPFFWRGFIYSLLGSIGGLCLINPPTSTNSFIAGLLGVATLTNILETSHETNLGASKETFHDSVFGSDKIKEIQNKEQSK